LHNLPHRVVSHHVMSYHLFHKSFSVWPLCSAASYWTCFKFTFSYFHHHHLQFFRRQHKRGTTTSKR